MMQKITVFQQNFILPQHPRIVLERLEGAKKSKLSPEQNQNLP